MAHPTAESIGPAGLYALQVMARLGGEILIDLSEGDRSQAAAFLLLTLADDGCCRHEPAGYIAGFVLTDIGWRIATGGSVH